MKVSNEVAKAEQHFYRRSLQENKYDYKKVFQICNDLLGWTKQSPLPESTSNMELVYRINTFFINKILNIHQQLVENNASLEHNIIMAENKLPRKDSFSFFFESVFRTSRISSSNIHVKAVNWMQSLRNFLRIIWML